MIISIINLNLNKHNLQTLFLKECHFYTGAIPQLGCTTCFPVHYCYCENTFFKIIIIHHIVEMIFVCSTYTQNFMTIDRSVCL